MLRFFALSLCLIHFLQAAESYWPLSIGNEWTYQVKSTYCPNGEKKSTVLNETTFSGRKAFEVTNTCEGFPSTYVSLDGENLDTEYLGKWYRLYDTPVKEGHVWEEFRTQAVWKRVGSVTVAAGTFQDCWRKIRKVSYTDWYEVCLGVGLVRSHMKDLGGGFIDMELKSYHLN